METWTRPRKSGASAPRRRRAPSPSGATGLLTARPAIAVSTGQVNVNATMAPEAK